MPRRYPRSVSAVPPSPVAAFPTPPPPAAAEDSSSQPSAEQRTNDGGGSGGDGQRQPMELTVPRRRASGGGAEREIGDDGLKRDAAGLCAPPHANGQPAMPGLRPMSGVSFPLPPPPPGDDEERRRANGDASDMQRQPMELVVSRRRPSGGLERELSDDGLKRPREEADDSRELDVVA